mmetsp:Transcript_47063/g.86263  ORF Transcript_47063/g.86263 Transcript_47063/m.86263 type:complete len:167 (+) Transcript_47063:88-588(+)
MRPLVTLLACVWIAHAAHERVEVIGGSSQNSRAVGVQDILAQSQERTVELQHGVSEMLQSSSQQMQTITSMLMTNSRQTAALNTLYSEMDQLMQRLGKFQVAMDECRKDLREAEQQHGEGIATSDDDSPDPLLGGVAAAAFFQLQMHANALHSDLSLADQMLHQSS